MWYKNIADRFFVTKHVWQTDRQTHTQNYDSQDRTSIAASCGKNTRMWADAQCDGHLAKYRWRPLFNAAVWLMPTTRVLCSNAAKTRNQLKLAAVPQTNEQISATSGRSSPYYDDMWRRYCCLTRFLPTVNTCLSCEDIARQRCPMVHRWRIFGNFLRLFSASHVQHVSDLLLNTY